MPRTPSRPPVPRINPAVVNEAFRKPATSETILRRGRERHRRQERIARWLRLDLIVWAVILSGWASL